MHAGWSPLHWAIYHDNVTVVRALLSAGAAAPYKKAQVMTATSLTMQHSLENLFIVALRIMADVLALLHAADL
jgi:ankyrin repeat protein